MTDQTLAYIIPNWQPPKGVSAVMTTRAGGVSQGPYASLNLGTSTRDDPQHVAANQRQLGRWISAENGQVVTPGFLHQVHGTDVLNLNYLQQPQCVLDVELQADASYCTIPHVACTVRVADCMPVLLAVPGGVAAIHAGWRGLAHGIIGNALGCLLKATGYRASSVVAWLGPCIGPQAFEVGEDVYQSFTQKHAENQQAFIKSANADKWLANLPLLGKLDLERHGVTQTYIDGRCTVENEALFYSYRRDQKVLGDTGRMAACVWLSQP